MHMESPLVTVPLSRVMIERANGIYFMCFFFDVSVSTVSVLGGRLLEVVVVPSRLEI